jgi:hypothetical protein
MELKLRDSLSMMRIEVKDHNGLINKFLLGHAESLGSLIYSNSLSAALKVRMFDIPK